MTLLCLGLSHRSAPMPLLDRVALDVEAASRLLLDVASSPFVTEAMVLATCNRTEVYADVAKFHGSVADVSDLLAKHGGVDRAELTPHLYVHYEDRAVHHLFNVAAGLDSMVVGEQQILGQVRSAVRLAQEAGTLGRGIGQLGQRALRSGKQVHAETRIDGAGASVVSVALDEAAARLDGVLAGRRVVVIGAGAMSSLAVARLRRSGVADLVVANRTLERAQPLVDGGVGLAIPLAELAGALESADLLISCTGSSGLVLELADLDAIQLTRGYRPLVVVDLALPHDIDPRAGHLLGISRLDLADVATLPGAQAPEAEVAAAKAIVEAGMAAFLADQAAQRVEPIVVSLRAHAETVVAAELERLRVRLPGLDAAALSELERSVRRVVSTLLHTPTVRMKQFAIDPEGQRYAEALQALFDLEPNPAALAEVLGNVDVLGAVTVRPEGSEGASA